MDGFAKFDLMNKCESEEFYSLGKLSPAISKVFRSPVKGRHMRN